MPSRRLARGELADLVAHLHAQELDGLVHVAAGLHQCGLAVHHPRAGAVAQGLDVRCADRGGAHVASSPWGSRREPLRASPPRGRCPRWSRARRPRRRARAPRRPSPCSPLFVTFGSGWGGGRRGCGRACGGLRRRRRRRLGAAWAACWAACASAAARCSASLRSRSSASRLARASASQAGLLLGLLARLLLLGAEDLAAVADDVADRPRDHVARADGVVVARDRRSRCRRGRSSCRPAR